MARKKDPPKPLFAVKHDFYDSLDNFTQQVINLTQTVSTLIELGVIPPDNALTKTLRERLEAVERSMLSDT